MFYAEDKLPTQDFMLSAMYSKHVSNIACQILIQKRDLSHFSLCIQGAYKVCKESLKTVGLWCQEIISISEKNTHQPLSLTGSS